MRIGVIIAVVLVAGAMVMWSVVPQLRGTRVAGRRVVRCLKGHLFTTVWVPGASVKAVRLGGARLQYCPVGRHWSLVLPVNESTLSPDELRKAQETRDNLLP